MNPPYSKKTHPWLSSKEISTLNWPHTKAGKAFFAGCKNFFSMMTVKDRENEIIWREPLIKHRFLNPGMPIETPRGGWLPLTRETSIGNPSQIAVDLLYRQECRKRGDRETADLIRKVVEGGSVVVLDYPDGTLYFTATP